MVRNLYDRWRHYIETNEYRKARQESQKCESDHVRRSKQIYHLREQVRRAEWVASWIAEDNQNCYKLEASDQNLWTNMDEQRTKTTRRIAHTARSAPCGSRVGNGQHGRGCFTARSSLLHCTWCTSFRYMRSSNLFLSDERNDVWLCKYICC